MLDKRSLLYCHNRNLHKSWSFYSYEVQLHQYIRTHYRAENQINSRSSLQQAAPAPAARVYKRIGAWIYYSHEVIATVKMQIYYKMGRIKMRY